MNRSEDVPHTDRQGFRVVASRDRRVGVGGVSKYECRRVVVGRAAETRVEGGAFRQAVEVGGTEGVGARILALGRLQPSEDELGEQFVAIAQTEPQASI